MARKTTLGEQIYYQHDDEYSHSDPRPAIRRFRIEEHETVALLHMGLQVEAAFGPSGMAIEWKDGHPIPETVRQVLLMRGIANQNMDGSGI